ncbi:MAG: hypothetical protein KGV44_06290 [Flavobacteriaceae bacterium]|nr:hypothetical protein [Flavobacteriaceae bacterium]
MLKSHSIIAGVVLLLLAITVVSAIIGWTQKKSFKPFNKKIGLFTLIAVHTQFLVGTFMLIYTYASVYANMGEVMKNSVLRLKLVEHPMMMLIGAIMVTIGWSKHKKRTSDIGKFKAFAIFYGITLLIFLSRIPWTQWLS